MSLFGNMKDLYKLQKQAKQIKAKLKKTHIEAETDGVTITINGEQEIIAVKISDEAYSNKASVEASIVKALNKAVKKSQEIGANEMKDIMGGMGLNLPGMGQ